MAMLAYSMPHKALAFILTSSGSVNSQEVQALQTSGGQAMLCFYSLTRTYFISSRSNTVSTARLQNTTDPNILNAPVIELPFHQSTLEHSQEQAVPRPFNRYVS